MRILVTGGAGFLGSHVAQNLGRQGHETIILDKVAALPAVLHTPNIRGEIGDFTDLPTVERLIADVDVVCHLGGVGDVYLALSEPYTAAAANVTGTANIAEACVRAGGKRLVYASTWEVYGKPVYEPMDEDHRCLPDHPYNVTKYGGELLALSYAHLKDLPVIALRLGTAFGTRMRPNSVFSLFIRKALAGEPITIQGDGSQSRQFVHARDVARAFEMAATSDISGEVFNIVTEESTSIKRLAELVQARFPTGIVFLPPRAGDIPPAKVTARRALDRLGWKADVSFEEGLNEIMDEAVAVRA